MKVPDQAVAKQCSSEDMFFERHALWKTCSLEDMFFGMFKQSSLKDESKGRALEGIASALAYAMQNLMDRTGPEIQRIQRDIGARETADPERHRIQRDCGSRETADRTGPEGQPE